MHQPLKIISKNAYKYYRLIGIVIFVIILSRIQFSHFIDAIKKTNYLLVLLSFGLTCIFVIIKSLCWHALLEQQKIKISMVEAIRINYIGIFFANVTPGRIGEVGKMLYLKEKAINFSYLGSFLSIVADRILDILTMLVINVIGVMYLFNIHIGIFSVGILVILVIVIGCYQFRTRIIQLPVRVINKGFRKLRLSQIELNSEMIAKRLGFIIRNNLLKVLLLNAFAWVFFYLLVYATSLACNITIDFYYLIIATSTSMILSMLPLTVSGIGVRDFVLISFFSRVNLTSEAALHYSFLYLFIFLLSSSIVGFIFYMFNKKIFSSSIT